MCGIAGILSENELDFAALAAMSSVLRHRGPDDEGFFVSGSEEHLLRGNDTIPALSALPHIASLSSGSACRLGFVHRRLSIIDTSPGGHQPKRAEDGNCVITYNGEIYNYKELRAELAELGFGFRTESDTEVILQAYRKWGGDCVKRFIGMWAFAIYDKRKQELFLSRDRFGIKPLYYFEGKQNLVFASEIKALFCLKEVEPLASQESCLEFVAYGAQTDPLKTLYRDVQQVAPGYNLIVKISGRSLKHEKYYDPGEAVHSFRGGRTQADFDSLLIDSVRLHMRSDVAIGSALSGGLDSSTVVALASKELQEKPFHTFTAAYQDEAIDESRYARMVARSAKNIRDHYCYPSASGYWQDLDKIIWHQDLPLSSTSMFAQWEVMKLASHQGIKVLLDGQGADEILGGYYNFAGIHLLGLLKRLRFAEFRREHAALCENFTPQINKAMARAFFYYLPPALQKIARSRERLSFQFLSEEVRDRAKKLTVPERGGKSFPEQSLLSIRFGLQDLLRFEDRNSMAFSVESRVPFLDHRLVEFCISIDEREKIHNGWTKYMLRKTAAGLLPAEVAWRKDKMGFLTPQKQWKEQSAVQLREFINDSPVPSFIDKASLLQLCAAGFNDSSRLSEFWKVISFIKWAQVFKVRFA